jgi:MFS family permease
MFLLPLGGKFASRFGLETSLAASLPLFVLYFLSLASIAAVRPMILAAALLLTCHKIFYWPAYHAIVSKFGDGKNRGTELSWMEFLRYGSSIIGPLMGGVIASTLGFPTLFLVASTLVIVSGLPLYRSSASSVGAPFPYASPWKVINSPKNRTISLSILGWGENLIDMVYWPLFLFLVLGSAATLGIYFSITLGCMTIIGFFIGNTAEHHSRRALRRTYIPYMMIGHLLRPFAITPLRVLATDGVARVSFAGVMLPMLYSLYADGKREGALRFAVAFEILIAVSKAITALLLASVFFILPGYPAFIVTFVLAALLCLLYAKL